MVNTMLKILFVGFRKTAVILPFVIYDLLGFFLPKSCAVQALLDLFAQNVDFMAHHNLMILVILYHFDRKFSNAVTQGI